MQAELTFLYNVSRLPLGSNEWNEMVRRNTCKAWTCFGGKAFLVLFEFWIGESRPFPLCNGRSTSTAMFVHGSASTRCWDARLHARVAGPRVALGASWPHPVEPDRCGVFVMKSGYKGFHFTPKPHRLFDNLQKLFLGCSTQPFVLRCHYKHNARKDWPKTCGPHYLWMSFLSSVGLSGRVAHWFACPIPWPVHRLLLWQKTMFGCCLLSRTVRQRLGGRKFQPTCFASTYLFP